MGQIIRWQPRQWTNYLRGATPVFVEALEARRLFVAIDPTFGVNSPGEPVGRPYDDNIIYTVDNIYTVLHVYADGSSLGCVNAPGDSAALLKFDARGNRDYTFAGDGSLRLVDAGNSGTAGGRADVGAVGLIYASVYEEEQGVERSFLRRYTATGQLDTTFGIGGTIEYAFNVADAESGFAGGRTTVLPDGKVLVFGSAGHFVPSTDLFNGDALVARLNADGTLDTTFGAGGVVRLELGSNDSVSFTTTDAQGRLYLAGQSRRPSGNGTDTSQSFVVRLLPNGQIDLSYGKRGVLAIALGDRQTSFEGMIIDDHGRLLLSAGWYTDLDAGSDRALMYHDLTSQSGVLRLTPDGQIDTTFSGDGVLMFGSGEPWAWNNLHLLRAADGKVLFSTDFDGNGRSYVGRSVDLVQLNDDGSLDQTFGDAGIWTGPPDLLPIDTIIAEGNYVYFSATKVIGEWDLADAHLVRIDLSAPGASVGGPASIVDLSGPLTLIDIGVIDPGGTTITLNGSASVPTAPLPPVMPPPVDPEPAPDQPSVAPGDDTGSGFAIAQADKASRPAWDGMASLLSLNTEDDLFDRVNADVLV